MKQNVCTTNTVYQLRRENYTCCWSEANTPITPFCKLKAKTGTTPASEYHSLLTKDIRRVHMLLNKTPIIVGLAGNSKPTRTMALQMLFLFTLTNALSDVKIYMKRIPQTAAKRFTCSKVRWIAMRSKHYLLPSRKKQTTHLNPTHVCVCAMIA